MKNKDINELKHFKRSFAQKLKYFREKKNLTAEALATQAEIHPVTVRKYECEASLPTVASLLKLAEVLDVKVTDFFVDKEELYDE